jgi:hypothetical protein
MRSSRVVRSSDSQCQSRNCPGVDPSILRNSGIWGAADEAVLNKELKNSLLKIPPFRISYMSNYYIFSTPLKAFPKLGRSGGWYDRDDRCDSGHTTTIRAHANAGKVMGHISMKTPGPKCRLYWCLIEFIVWRYSQSRYEPVQMPVRSWTIYLWRHQT